MRALELEERSLKIQMIQQANQIKMKRLQLSSEGAGARMEGDDARRAFENLLDKEEKIV